jgi:uncharacterized iron-regulated membrane protein
MDWTQHAAAPQARRRRAARAVALWLHRYVGLCMALFLVVAGLTGSLLAFYHELDARLNPGLFHAAEPAAGARALDPFELREALQRQLPLGLEARRVSLESRAGVNALLEVSAADPKSEGDDEYFLDPYTGRVLGSRRWGDLKQGMVNLMPFVFRLHYSLALGNVGSFLFGVVALLWTIDCFVGAYLTLPAPRTVGRRGFAVWLARWKPAWLVRGGQLFSWVFTWHRASGLWVWVMLLVFAWSAVGLNLHQVYGPLMKAVVGLEEWPSDRLPTYDPPLAEPGLEWREARRRGQALMAEQSAQLGFTIHAERLIAYHPDYGAFRYQVYSSLDISERFAATTVWFERQTGALLAFEAPTGQNTGRSLTMWLYQLHFGAVDGLGSPYRVFVCLMGLAIAVLSVTGVWVWWVKRMRRWRPRSWSNS